MTATSNDGIAVLNLSPATALAEIAELYGAIRYDTAYERYCS